MLDMKYCELSKDGFGCCMTVKQTLFSGQSEFQKVDIFDTESMGRVLTLDGLMMTTERDEFYYHEMISHIPMKSAQKSGIRAGNRRRRRRHNQRSAQTRYSKKGSAVRN